MGDFNQKDFLGCFISKVLLQWFFKENLKFSFVVVYPCVFCLFLAIMSLHEIT